MSPRSPTGAAGSSSSASLPDLSTTCLHREVTDHWITHTPTDRPAAERLVALAKGWITWQAREIVTESRERCGARALFPVNGLAEYPANADGAITAEGDNLAIWCKAAADMIFGHTLARPRTPSGNRPGESHRSRFPPPRHHRRRTPLAHRRTIRPTKRGGRRRARTLEQRLRRSPEPRRGLHHRPGC
ncbi:acyl-CoA dehydrogenase family protein [Streptomyces pseudogriseolus]|uniref:acyl-CoA dehydrogenase family protein n=1 Tax=Streptomyces pseudogriseolus TaxID=36817 RepID=UPI003FA2DCD4